MSTDYDKIDEANQDNEAYRLTPWACLLNTLKDYGIDASHISGKVGGHIVDDFMDAMAKAGYIRKETEVEA